MLIVQNLKPLVFEALLLEQSYQKVVFFQIMHFLRVLAAVGIFFLAAKSPSSLGATTCQRDSNLGKKRLMQAIKQDILLRLGFEEEPPNPSNASDIPEEFLNEYEAVKEAQELDYAHKPCAMLDFNTREVMPVSPKEVKQFKPDLRTAVGDDCISESVAR